MMSDNDGFAVNVDLTNPGQFFAACGLLELADRLWSGAEGWFEAGQLHVMPTGAHASSGADLAALMDAVAKSPIQQLDPQDETASPLQLGEPFDLRLDWWIESGAGANPLKVWAGSMRGPRIAVAMQSALRDPTLWHERMFDHAAVVYDDQQKKVEPFYFDARRGANAQALDIGFMPDALSMTTLAYPAVEFLCLVGLQRFQPAATSQRRVFEYFQWGTPLPPIVGAVAVQGALKLRGQRRFRFASTFRTDQRKHKAFAPATLMET